MKLHHTETIDSKHSKGPHHKPKDSKDSRAEAKVEQKPSSPEKDETILSQSGEPTEPVERIMELDQDDKALAITGRPTGLPYSAFVINEYAQRMHRKDFMEMVVRHCFDFFDGRPEKQAEIMKCAEEMAK